MPLVAATLDVLAMGMGLLGGVALFLFGLQQMTGSLKGLAGSGMRALLEKVTGTPLSGALTGALVTAAIQSSAVTTVLVVGFVEVGQMSLRQAIGVILGANVGTTVTAQIVAFRITEYALLLVGTGFLVLAAARRTRVRQVGELVMGFGLLFLGMAIMGESTAPLRTHPPFLHALEALGAGPLAVLAGTVVTALVQSSSVTTGIVIVLAGQGLMPLETGIAVVLGANVGSCVPAVLAAVGKSRVAIRAALAHVVFNVLGVLLWIGLVPVLADLVRRISPAADGVEGLARLAADTPRQIANAHTVFNVANTLLFLPLTGLLARIVTRLVPDRPEAEGRPAEPRFLDPVYLPTPRLALDRMRQEVGHLGALSLTLLERLEPTGPTPFDLRPGPVERAVADVDRIYAAILGYGRRLAGGTTLSEADARELEDLLQAANHLQAVADVVPRNLAPLLAEW